MTTLLSTLGQVMVVAGAIVFATAALGIIRFPDPYTRISAVGTASGIGIVLVVGGVFLVQPSVPDLVKLIIFVVLHLATSAVGSMAIARAAYLTGTPLHRRHFDELADNRRSNDSSPSGP